MQENTINPREYIQSKRMHSMSLLQCHPKFKKKLGKKQKIWNEKKIFKMLLITTDQSICESNLMHNICELKSMHEKLSIKIFVHNLNGIQNGRKICKLQSL